MCVGRETDVLRETSFRRDLFRERERSSRKDYSKQRGRFEREREGEMLLADRHTDRRQKRFPRETELFS